VGEAFFPHMKLFKGNTMIRLVRSGKNGVHQTKGQIQKNSFNPSSDNLVLEKGSPNTRNFAFYQQKASSMQDEYLKDMFIKATKSVCTSATEAPPHPLSPTPSTSSTMKIPENTEEDPDDPEPAAEEGIQTEYSSD